MNRALRLPCLSLSTLGFVLLWTAGCHSNQQAANNSDQIKTRSNSTRAIRPRRTSRRSLQEARRRNEVYPDRAYSDQDSGLPPEQDTADEAEYGIQPEDSAPQPPPSLPDYDQPPCPGDGYIWAPGYWYYAPAGYYWVPGAWVAAPFTGALWTPGYWAFARGRYNYFHGYWGPHIGFYGGVNYGYGYTGYGYRGGYWQGNSVPIQPLGE